MHMRGPVPRLPSHGTGLMQVLSVREMFGRHLTQLPGVSAEKAAAVLEQYPTVAQ